MESVDAHATGALLALKGAFNTKGRQLIPVLVGQPLLAARREPTGRAPLDGKFQDSQH
jgi:hypothetical protein